MRTYKNNKEIDSQKNLADGEGAKTHSEMHDSSIQSYPDLASYLQSLSSLILIKCASIISIISIHHCLFAISIRVLFKHRSNTPKKGYLGNAPIFRQNHNGHRNLTNDK